MPDSCTSTVALAERAFINQELLFCPIGNAYQGRALTQIFRFDHGSRICLLSSCLLFLVFSLRS